MSSTANMPVHPETPERAERRPGSKAGQWFSRSVHTRTPAEQAEQDSTSRSVAFGSVRLTPEQGNIVVVWVKRVCSARSGILGTGGQHGK